MIDITETTVESENKKRAWKVVAVVAFVLFLGVWFLSPTGAINQLVKMERGADGQLHAVEGEEGGNGFTVNAHAGVVNANSSRTTTSASNYSDPGWFQARSLVLLNQSDHLLMKRVGQSLLTELNKRPHWESVLYLPHDHDQRDKLSPSDIYMTIDLASIKESGIVGRDLDVKVLATIGTSFISSHHSVHDSLSAPTVSFRTRVALDHKSSLTGVESAGARYSLQGAEIAKELMTALNDQIDTLNEKHGPPPSEIEKFLADYHPAPELKFLGARQPIFSTHGTMLHNETLWTLENVGNVEEFFEKISDELQATGWTEYSKQLEKHAIYLRLKNETKWLEVFPKDSPIDGTMAERRKAPDQWFVRYRERMSQEDLQNIYGQFLDKDQTDVELLLALESLANQEQRERLYQRLESQKPATAGSWLKLANWYARKDQSEQLVNALQQATVASLFLRDSGDIKKKIKKMITKHELDEKQIAAIDTTILAESGIQSLSPSKPETVQKFDVEKPIAFYIPSEKPSEWKYVAAVVNETEVGLYRVSYFNGDQKRSSGSSSMCCISMDRPNNNRFNFKHATVEMTIKKLSENHFEASVKLVMKEEKAPDKVEEPADLQAI